MIALCLFAYSALCPAPTIPNRYTEGCLALETNLRKGEEGRANKFEQVAECLQSTQFMHFETISTYEYNERYGETLSGNKREDDNRGDVQDLR